MTKAPKPDKNSKKKLTNGEYTVDQLAQITETTVRNILSYQNKGVLKRPEKRGRTGVYNDSHISRLANIKTMLDRGYSIENIKDLLDGWAKGLDLDSILGLEQAVSHSFNDEEPAEYTVQELNTMFGLKETSLPLLQEAVKHGLLFPQGEKFVAPSPTLLNIGAQMISFGSSFEAVLELHKILAGNLRRAADGLVRIVVDRFDVFDESMQEELLQDESLNQLSEIIWHMRTLATDALMAEAKIALNQSLRDFLGDRVSGALEELHDKHEK